MPVPDIRDLRQLLKTGLKLAKADLAMVDPQSKEAGMLLDELFRLQVPVILLLDENEKDWENLLALNVCGYLQTNKGVCVLSSHLKALLRRFDSGGTVVDQLVNSAFETRNRPD
jgi:hypothetical protein